MYNIVICNIKVKTHIKHISITITGNKKYGRKEQKNVAKCKNVNVLSKSDGLWIL